MALTLNHIGDVLFTEPAIAALRAGYPDAHFIVITSPEGQAILKHHPAVDEVWVRRRGIRGWWTIARRLHQSAPTLAVSFSPSSLGLALCAFLSKAPKRYGFAFRPLLPSLFTFALPLDPKHHVVDDYLTLAKVAGGKIERRQPILFISDEERLQAYQRLQALGWDSVTPLLGCHPFSSVANKEWEIDNFIALLIRLRKRYGLLPIVFGSVTERARAEQIAQNCEAVVAAGALSLREFIAAVTWCSGFIGGDSGPTHIAAASGVPTLALFGPTNPDRTGPLGKHVAVIRSPTGKMQGISLDTVLSTMTDFWSKVRGDDSGVHLHAER